MCGQTQEKSSHFFKCRNAIAKRPFKKMLEKIHGNRTDIRTVPEIRSIVMQNLKSWRDGKVSKKIKCKVQEVLGRELFLRGRITQEVSQRIVPKDTDHEGIDRKVAKLIATINDVANGPGRCDATAIESGCMVEINRRMRLLCWAGELGNVIVSVGLGHLQQSSIHEIAT